MAPTKIHIETIEMLLASITLTMGDDGLRSSFLFGEPNAPHWEKRMGAEIFYHFAELQLVALHVRGHGPKYLKSLPLDNVASKLQHFIAQNFWFIRSAFWTFDEERPLNTWISAHEKNQLAQALATDPIFAPTNELTLFPLVPIKVQGKLVYDNFFFTSPDADDPFSLGDGQQAVLLDPKKFPPQNDFEGSVKYPVSWLGVHSPDYRAALKTRASILGAVALTSRAQYRHQFSMKAIFGGRCTLTPSGTTVSFENTHTPACMYNISLTAADQHWLTLLDKKISSEDKKMVQELRALEYFYRAWPLAPEERFAIYCMALDALFSDAGNATQSVVDGLRQTLGGQLDERRLKLLLNLRGSVIHGRAPDVYEAKKYPIYFRKYRADPITDLELIVGASLRQIIFQNTLNEHADPNAEVIADARKKRILPPAKLAYSILNPNPVLVEIKASEAETKKSPPLEILIGIIRRLIKACNNFWKL